MVTTKGTGKSLVSTQYHQSLEKPYSYEPLTVGMVVQHLE